MSLSTRLRTVTPSRNSALQTCTRYLATETITEQSASQTTADPPPTIAPASRPSRQWSRPIHPGVIKAYDEALSLIRHDSNLKRREIQQLQKSLRLKPDQPGAEEMQQRIRKLEVQSEINLPEVRWGVNNDIVDMDKSVFRHLLEQRWRKEGRLDLLMERVHQMHVLPDVVPAIHPTLDLHVIFERSKTSTAVDRWLDVEPGVFLPSRRTMGPPRIQATVFHPETRLYTLMIVDPDVPDPANKTFQTYLHLLQPNVPLSAQTTFRKNISLKSTPVPYVPPHPQKGTPYHRYVTLLLPQLRPIELKKKDIPRREGFNVRDFVAKYQLGSLSASEAVKMNMVPETYAEKIGGGLGGGIHMWREVWDEDVSQIYKGILKTPEPTYGHPPKPDPYQGQKKNKYF